MNTGHDLMQAHIDLIGRPSHTHRVLCHLQTAGSHTTGIHSLTGCKQLMGSRKLVHSLSRTAHIRHLGNTQRLLSQYLVGIVAVQLVLRSTGQIDVGLLLPRLLAGKELRTGELLLVGLADVITAGTQLQHILYLLVVQAIGVVDVSVRTADGNDLRTQLGSLLRSTPRHIAEARQRNGLALDVETVGLHHVMHEIQCTVTRGLRTQDTTTPLYALTGQRGTVELRRQTLVLSEEITNLTGTHADVTSGYVHIRTDNLI